MQNSFRLSRGALLGISLALAGSRAFAGNIVSISDAFPNSEIYYQISYLDSRYKNYKSDVISALRYWESKTNLTFIPMRTDWVPGNAPKSIRFVEANSNLAYCSSNIGVGAGTATVTCNISNSSSLRHEIGHAIGFFHEHARSDRGSHIYVDGCPPIFLNGIPVYDFEAMRTTSSTWGTPESWNEFQNDYCPVMGNPTGTYDRASLMHYSRKVSEDYFIRPRGSNLDWLTHVNCQAVEISGNWMNGTTTLSAGDISAANTLYPVNGTNLYLNNYGAMYATTQLMPGSFRKLMQSGNRIGALTASGILFVKEGVSGTWVDELQNVLDFDLEGDRIGALTSDGILRVKEGPLTHHWVVEHGSVTQFDLEGNRIGVLLTSGELKVKEGGLSATWVSETGNVFRFRLEDERIGVLYKNNELWVKEGGLSDTWVGEAVGVSNFFLEDDVIMIFDGASRLWAKKGPLSALWKDFGIASKVTASNGNMAYTTSGLELKLTGWNFYSEPITLEGSGISGDLFMHGPKVNYITRPGGEMRSFDINTNAFTVVTNSANSFGQ